MENGVRRGFLFYQPNRLTSRYDDQLDSAAFRLTLHAVHYWQTAVRSGADHKPAALPRYLLFKRQGRMPKLVAEPLGRCLLAFADLPAIDHHVLFVRAAVDSQRPEGKLIEVHTV